MTALTETSGPSTGSERVSAAVSGRGDFAGSIAELTEIRARDPRRIQRLLDARHRRPLLGDDGKLMIIACDHPARGALAAQGRPTAMASRTELLERLLTALARPGVDGLLATADIAEDLLLLGALEDKVVFASSNRGGLQGSAFELDDRVTSYDVQGVLDARFDGLKMLTRIDLADPATVATLETQAAIITELNRRQTIAMVEPFLSSRVGGKIVNDLSPEAVIKSMHIAQGLGASSAYTWLKLPVVHEMERVMDATTLPTLLLGGDPEGSPDDTYAAWQAALELPSVRGLMVGRTMLYPADGDVANAVDTAVSLVR
jgi:DhnA family fructose-bisphosphate aldolase class Ia